MFGYLRRLDPSTIHAYASCLEFRRDLGHVPEWEDIQEVAKCPSPTAVLVLVRWELPAADGTLVPLNVAKRWESPPVVVPDEETALAILAVGRPVSARMVDAEGKEVRLDA